MLADSLPIASAQIFLHLSHSLGSCISFSSKYHFSYGQTFLVHQLNSSPSLFTQVCYCSSGPHIVEFSILLLDPSHTSSLSVLHYALVSLGFLLYGKRATRRQVAGGGDSLLYSVQCCSAPHREENPEVLMFMGPVDLVQVSERGCMEAVRS